MDEDEEEEEDDDKDKNERKDKDEEKDYTKVFFTRRRVGGFIIKALPFPLGCDPLLKYFSEGAPVTQDPPRTPLGTIF